MTKLLEGMHDLKEDMLGLMTEVVLSTRNGSSEDNGPFSTDPLTRNTFDLGELIE